MCYNEDINNDGIDIREYITRLIEKIIEDIVVINDNVSHLTTVIHSVEVG